MSVKTTIRFEYFCEGCSKTDIVEYHVREGNIYPKPFVSAYSNPDEIAPGTNFVRTKNGKIFCLDCKEASK